MMFLSSLLLNAQNLILNGSFENFKRCPSSITTKHLKLKDGIKSIGSADYFNGCSPNFNPEFNPFGRQVPFEGKGFCGLILTSDYPQECDYREFIQLKLIEPLEKGKKYVFSMQVSLADSSGYYTDQIGVKFLQNKVDKKAGVKPFFGKSSINNPLDRFITDSKSWTEIQGIYNAKGGEKYILIGNFQKCNQTTRKAVLPNSPETVLENMKRKFREDISGSTLKVYNHAYYFIDALVLEPFKWNDSLSFLDSKEACWEGAKELVTDNLVEDGGFSLNKGETNPYWETASKGTPDFLDDKVGLYLYSDIGKNNREYIIAKLKKKLSPCKEYAVEVKIKRSEAYQFAVDQFQIAVLDSHHFANDRMRFDLVPVFSSPKNKIISNADQWMKLCGHFSPKSCSEYLVIGNFSNDDSTFVLPMESSTKEGPYAYYFLDDIVLKEKASIDDCSFPCISDEVNEVMTKEDSSKKVLPEVTLKDTLLFLFESTATHSQKQINRSMFVELIDSLQDNDSLKIIVEGHADKSGNEKKNIELSKARAEGVYNYLLQLSIPKRQLELKFHGSRRPKVSNSTPEGRAKNRRVEVYLSR